MQEEYGAKTSPSGQIPGEVIIDFMVSLCSSEIMALENFSEQAMQTYVVFNIDMVVY